MLENRSNQEKSQSVRAVLSFIEANYWADIGKLQLKKVAGDSWDEFEQLFCSEQGVSPLQWLWTFRVIVAASLIMEQPRLSLSQIWLETGFPDGPYFFDCFAKLVGLGPDDLRNNLLQLSRFEPTDTDLIDFDIDHIKQLAMPRIMELSEAVMLNTFTGLSFSQE